MLDKKTQNDEQSKQEVTLEDLPVEESKQEEIKGGPTFSSWLPS